MHCVRFQILSMGQVIIDKKQSCAVGKIDSCN